ncbi:BamA/TamA family outer membrane protein [Granulicella sp. 5B5]|nr:BamA/TamA family outer membrane protein [Granulicella sp. 5B5]
MVSGFPGALLAQTSGSDKPTATTDTTASADTQAPSPEPPASIFSKQGMTVQAIHFTGVTFAERDPIIQQLKQKGGTPLDPEAVRSDLRTLFATGRYMDIAVSDQPGTNGNTGIVLDYSGTPRYFVGRVTITGVNEDRLTALLDVATKLQPGAPFSGSDLPEAMSGLKDTLTRNGYYRPVIDQSVTRDDVNNQVNVTFHITIGPQARVGGVSVTGQDPGISTEQFRRHGSLDCSKLETIFSHHCRPRVTRNTVPNALSGVRSYYQNNRHLEGTITLPDSSYNVSRKQVDYEFSANQGPQVDVVIKGFKLSRSRIKLLVPIFEEGAVDNDLLNEGSFNIRDYLQQRGYFDASVSVDLSGQGTKALTVTYTVASGILHKVVSVRMTGNHYFDQDTISELLRVKKGDNYQPSGRFSSTLLRSDISGIESLYRSNGFEQVNVTSDVQDKDKDASGKRLRRAQLQVLYRISEGTQQRFGTISLEGVSASQMTAVKGVLSSTSGQPYSLLALSNDRDAVFTYYLSRGYEHVSVDLAQSPNKTDGNQMDAVLTVHEGQQVFTDNVLLSGLDHIRPSVVQKEILVKADTPLDQAALLQTQRNLYNLAEFNDVNVVVQNPDGMTSYKNVLIQLTEGKRWDVTYGFGIEAQSGTPAIVAGETRGSTAAQNGKAGVSPRVSLDVSRTALRGTQDSLTLHTTYGLLEEVATVTYNSPHLLGKKQLTGLLSGGYSNVQDITTFSSSTLQGDFRVSQKLRRADTLIYDFQYRRVSIDKNSLAITPNLINQLSEPVIVGGPGFTFLHDTRDPSPLNANKGQFFSLQDFLATSKFGSGTNFNKLDGSESTYYTFGKHRYVFARNLRIGFENSWGPNPNASNAGSQIGVSSTACTGSLLATNPTCNPVPLPERLYAGGASSHRGFGINDAGPRDLTTGYPVGGSGVVVNTFELRLPPPVLPLVGDSISFVLFHDMGNTFRYPGDMFTSFLHFRQPNRGTCRDLSIPGVAAGATPTPTQQENAVGICNFNYYSHALGVGIRYNTPVGPIRADFSYNLNPPIYPVFDDYTNALPYVGEGSHFNFFFSIGQSF